MCIEEFGKLLGYMIWLLPIVAALVAAVLVIALWPREGPMGINLKRTYCPRCGHRVPRWRRPADGRQALWGGWTCSRCGCEMDKYGKET